VHPIGPYDARTDRTGDRHPLRGSPMTLETILIIALLVVVLGGGGFYWSRR
jgi:hypothetical protein